MYDHRFDTNLDKKWSKRTGSMDDDDFIVLKNTLTKMKRRAQWRKIEYYLVRPFALFTLLFNKFMKLFDNSKLKQFFLGKSGIDEMFDNTLPPREFDFEYNEPYIIDNKPAIRFFDKDGKVVKDVLIDLHKFSQLGSFMFNTRPKDLIPRSPEMLDEQKIDNKELTKIVREEMMVEVEESINDEDITQLLEELKIMENDIKKNNVVIIADEDKIKNKRRKRIKNTKVAKKTKKSKKRK